MRPIRLFTLSALALAANHAAAQTAPASGTDAADTLTVVVTARRVDERIIDVPLTIKALSGAALQDRGITSISELSQFTPGMSFSPDFGRVSERPVVRGISALRPEAPQPVSVFVDGIFVRDGSLGLLLDDAQRVEIIKGPQSALYGRSTYAGAINYITVKPGNTFSGTASVTAAEAAEFSAFGAVSVPLIDNVLSMRAKVKSSQFGGQYTNSQTGNALGTEKTDAAGVQLFFRPSDRFDARLSLDRSDERDGFFNATVRTVPILGPTGLVVDQNGSTNVPNGGVCNGRTINIVGNNAVTGLPDATVVASATTRGNGWVCGPATISGTVVRRNENDFVNYTDPSTGINYGNIAGLDRGITRMGLTLNYDFAGYTLTSQTGYTRQQTNVGADQSYNGTRFAPAFLGGSSWASYDRDALKYLSQEVRLASPDNQDLTWLLGAFYYDEKGNGLTSGVITSTGFAPLRAKSGSEVSNMSPFGRVQYAFSKALRVSVEGRYNRETVEVIGTPLGVALTTAGTCVAGQQCVIQASKTFTDFSPRVTVDFKPMKDVLVYGQVAAGSKSGGFNTAAGIPAASFAYDGEKVKSGELGVKASLAGGRVGFSAALFRNNVDGLQLSNLITIINPFSATGANTTTTIVNNVGKARSQGLELDGSVRATDWLTLSANYAYTDAKALQGTEVTNGTVFGGNMSVAGFTLPRTPKHSVATSAALDLPLTASGVRMTGRIDVVHQSRRYAEIQNMVWADPYTRINLAAGLKGKDWRVSLWVKNAANDDTSINGFRYVDPSTFRRSAVDFLPRLRQVGLTAGLDF